jgi:hypothetical protein
VIVYLWDAGRWCGVSGSMPDALAADSRRGDSGATVEAARLVDSTRSLVRTYQRTGDGWSVQPGATTWRELKGRRAIAV